MNGTNLYLVVYRLAWNGIDRCLLLLWHFGLISWTPKLVPKASNLQSCWPQMHSEHVLPHPLQTHATNVDVHREHPPLVATHRVELISSCLVPVVRVTSVDRFDVSAQFASVRNSWHLRSLPHFSIKSEPKPSSCYSPCSTQNPKAIFFLVSGG